MTGSDPIGFVGLGNMGAPMATRLAGAGHRLVVFDLDREAAAALAGAHDAISPAETLSALGASCRTVITMLPTGADVRTVALGEGGLAAAMAEGGVIVDMSSSEPSGTRALGEALEAEGVSLLDAPVSGGVPRAEDGTLAIMTGGPAVLIDRLQPMLEAMGTVYRTGSLGTGHAMKALNNYLSASGVAAACEAVLVGERFGLDPHVMTEILNVSTGRNNATANKLEQHILNRRFATGFTLKLMAKDVGMAKDLARELGVEAPSLAVTSERLDAALAVLEPGADHTAYHRYLEQLGGEGEET